jgi:hypothetical protein
MKPEGNRVGNCIGWTVKPQRTIGYEEEAQAESYLSLPINSEFLPQVIQFSGLTGKVRSNTNKTARKRHGCRKLNNKSKGILK